MKNFVKKSQSDPATLLSAKDLGETPLTLEEMWRGQELFFVSVLFVSASGQVLVCRQPDGTWSLPSKQGFGTRMDYDAIVGRIASPLGLTCSAQQLVPLCEYKGSEQNLYAVIGAHACDQRFWQREHVRWISPEINEPGLDVLARVAIRQHMANLSSQQAA